MLAHTSQTVALAPSSRIATALVAGSLGTVLLFFAAFAHSSTLHDAAHDTRHAIVVPCH